MTQHIGQRLKQWRTEQNLTQGEIAKRLGCSVQHVCDIEHGNRLIRHNEYRSPILQKIESLIGWEPTNWQATASQLDAENARLAADNQRLRAEIETLRTALRSTAGHTHHDD